MSYLVFDIETVPDLSVWTPPPKKADEIERITAEREKKPTKPEVAFLDLVTTAWQAKKPVHTKDLEKAHGIAKLLDAYQKTAEVLKGILDEREVGEEEKDAFPPIYAHRPVAIGYAVLGDDFSIDTAGCVGTTSFGDNEAGLLSGFGQFAAGHTLVSFNGKAFDMPVILLRSFKHGVGHGWHGKDHRYRYDENRHVDLKLALADYDTYKKGFNLDTFAKLCGLPGKGPVDGSMVAGMYDEGKHTEIERYCLSDALQTSIVFLRFMLMRGRLSVERYQEAATKLLAWWNAHDPEQAGKIDTKLLLLQG